MLVAGGIGRAVCTALAADGFDVAFTYGRNHDGAETLAAELAAAGARVPKADILSAAPKSAIETLFRGIAKEEGRNGIRANCVGPGWIDGGMGRRVVAEQFTPAKHDRLLAGTRWAAWARPATSRRRRPSCSRTRPAISRGRAWRWMAGFSSDVMPRCPVIATSRRRDVAITADVVSL
ncbi:hypothetical protein GCM10011505_06380 [Tistrella bauzanensis]|uniref:Uncharacterized protein n=1 Tax=Tistrella bauzanensis TaxID=657419 RepID=A0ABQ1I9V6_9PROT|nr:hypothetical protein GCM10011505_06380 [Tistrella bauzanensis]